MPVLLWLFRGIKAVEEVFSSDKTINIPFAVLGELYLGAYKSSNPSKHLNQIHDFLTECVVLVADSETANHYAQIKTLLLKKGKPITENDIWIAVISEQYQFTLMTRDKQFEEIESSLIIQVSF